MAAAGLTGQAHMLEHESGMVALMGHRFSQRIEAAMAKIGVTPAIDEYQIVFKPWPSCGYTHRIMTGMLELRSYGRHSLPAGRSAKNHAGNPVFQ